ncbi:MAG: GatB/YqeY domain-containing protein, partial [Candidatus Gottesmanbacteria bacterium]|nr:GatB/YqeY domain-containing protein [Candidatus Gottesmanbacteria bacterium]
MLMDRLQTDLTTSLKAGERDRVETIRFLIADVHNIVTAKYGADWEKKMTDADVLDAVKKQI